MSQAGALPGLLSVRFPRPLAVPAVPISRQGLSTVSAVEAWLLGRASLAAPLDAEPEGVERLAHVRDPSLCLRETQAQRREHISDLFAQVADVCLGAVHEDDEVVGVADDPRVRPGLSRGVWRVGAECSSGAATAMLASSGGQDPDQAALSFTALLRQGRWRGSLTSTQITSTSRRTQRRRNLRTGSNIGRGAGGRH